MASQTRVFDVFHHHHHHPFAGVDPSPHLSSEMRFFSDYGGGGGGGFLQSELKINEEACDGFSTCTEVLGFESSSGERCFSGEESCSSTAEMEVYTAEAAEEPQLREEEEEEEERRSFPPLLSSLSMDGRPSFCLLQTRKGGRLEVSSVRIRRPEFFMASRHNGRLRMYLVREDDGDGEVDGDGDGDGDGEVREEEEDCRRLRGGGDDGGALLWRWPELVRNRQCQHGRRQQCVG